MRTKGDFKLGEFAAITFYTKDVNESVSFYEKLGFTVVSRIQSPLNLAHITDGDIRIILRKGETPYSSLTYFTRSFNDVLAKISGAELEITQHDSFGGFRRCTFQTPDGFTIALVTLLEEFDMPYKPHILSLDAASYRMPERYLNKTCGLFGEFAHGVVDIGKSIAFWEGLGFNVLSRFDGPYPWAIVSDDLSVIGLHQTASLPKPTITYFASDMEEKTRNLTAKLGSQAFAAPPMQHGGTLRTPEDQSINLFALP